MDETGTTSSNYTEPSAEQTPPEEPELSHSDKIIGIFSEPKVTFEKISRFPPRTIDWFLPVLLLLIIFAITNIIMMSNPEIKLQAQEKQMEQMRKGFDDAVEKGRMTREQADDQLNQMQDRMNNPLFIIIIPTVFIFIVGFIVFFIMSGIYFLFARFVLKGEGSYGSVMVSSGLTAYIGIIQIIIAAVLAIAFGRLIQDTSLAALLNSNRFTLIGWLEAKIDPFSIWATIVFGIGLAKMFKSQTIGKYYALVFGVWIIGGLILFYTAKAIPMLSGFVR